jgi:hypothetical protein
MSLSWMIVCQPDPFQAAVLFSFRLLEPFYECIDVASSHLICRKYVILFLKLCSFCNIELLLLNRYIYMLRSSR